MTDTDETKWKREGLQGGCLEGAGRPTGGPEGRGGEDPGAARSSDRGQPMASSPCTIRLPLLALVLTTASCAGVRQDDLQAWVGAPVSALETHPFFVAMPVVRTRVGRHGGLELRKRQQRGRLLRGRQRLCRAGGFRDLQPFHKLHAA